MHCVMWTEIIMFWMVLTSRESLSTPGKIITFWRQKNHSGGTNCFCLRLADEFTRKAGTLSPPGVGQLCVPHSTFRVGSKWPRGWLTSGTSQENKLQGLWDQASVGSIPQSSCLACTAQPWQSYGSGEGPEVKIGGKSRTDLQKKNRTNKGYNRSLISVSTTSCYICKKTRRIIM